MNLRAQVDIVLSTMANDGAPAFDGRGVCFSIAFRQPAFLGVLFELFGLGGLRADRSQSLIKSDISIDFGSRTERNDSQRCSYSPQNPIRNYKSSYGILEKFLSFENTLCLLNDSYIFI